MAHKKKIANGVLGLLLVVVMVFTSACTTQQTQVTQQSQQEVKNTTAVSAQPAPVAKDPVIIRIAHDNSIQTAGHKAFEKFGEILSAETDGRITVQIFPSSQLGSVQDMFEQTRRGDIEMSAGATTLFTQTIPEFAVWDSFFMFDDAEHAHRVLDGAAGMKLMEPLDAMNLVGLGYMEIGFRNFSNSRRPIIKAEDVKGLKIRGYSPMQIKAWESAGASLSSIAWAEVFTSLQQKLIDGQESAVASFFNAKFYEAQKYLSITNHIYTNWLWYVNKDFMNSLSAEDKLLIENAAKEAIAFDRSTLAAEEDETLENLPGLGVEINEVVLEERQKLGKIMNDAIQDTIIEMCGQELYDFVNAEIEAARK